MTTKTCDIMWSLSHSLTKANAPKIVNIVCDKGLDPHTGRARRSGGMGACRHVTEGLCVAG